MEKQNLMYHSNITKIISDDEYSQIGLLFESLEALSRLTNPSMIVIDFYRNELIFRTDTLLFTDEASHKDKQRESTNPYWSLIKEENLNRLLETRRAYLELVDSFSYQQKLHHTFVIDYNIYIKHQEHTITQKFTPLKLRPDGQLWLGLFIFTTSPHDDCGQVELFGEGFRYWFDFEKNQFLQVKEIKRLSQIEKSIIIRASKGMTTHSIANDLCRSVETIKTYKKRLFKKFGVTSMAEAIAYASNYGLL